MNILRLKHRLTGAAGSPTGTGFKSGEVVINFTPTGTPEFWSYDGANWRQINPPSVVTTANIALPGGTAGSATGIGAAYTALTSKPTASVVVASFAGTSYIKTGAGGADTDWASLGSAASYATAAEINTGTEANKAIAPDQLRAAALKAPSATPANDENHLVILNAQGKLDPGFLPVGGLVFKGGVAPTAAPAAGAKAGDMYFFNAAGSLNTGFGQPAGTNAKTGDTIIFDGTAWHLIPNETDLNAYLALAGGTMSAKTSKISWPAATPATPEVYLDLNGGQLDNALIECGTF
jgi:hypothetical protein